jgi:hypothetical protein
LKSTKLGMFFELQNNRKKTLPLHF